MFDEPNILETALSAVALLAGVAAFALCPALAPLGVVGVLIGAGGLVFGHW